MKPILLITKSLVFILITNFTAPKVSAIENTKLYRNIEKTLEKNIFDQRLLSTDTYTAQQQKTRILIDKELSNDEFIEGFNDIWINGEISHIRLDKTSRTANQIYDYVENMNVGDEASTLTWKNGVPIMTINSMMGQDTIKRINLFYNEIVKKPSSTLIIDLRANKGGAFALKPLLGHLIDKPLNVGRFITRKWYEKNSSLPRLNQLTEEKGYLKTSLKGFWEHLESNSISSVQLSPVAPLFSGHIYVLISANTESAAEMAADALSNLHNVTLIGRNTAGKMLSQKMYDVADGIQLSLPIANYQSIKNGVIEGKGIQPDIEVDSQKALSLALEMAAKLNSRK